MLEFFNIKHDIPFMSYARVTTIISLVTFIAGGGFAGDSRV